MRTRVTAILVAQRGGEWLDQTIAGIAGQTLAPANIIAVNNGGSDDVREQLLSSGAERVVGIPSRVAFGQAVARAVEAMAPLSSEGNAGVRPDAPLTRQGEGQPRLLPGTAPDEWIWLLSEDSCPEPAALERIVSTVQRSPSVVVAGPKVVDWDHPDRIIELGQSLTRHGARWTLRRQELDQQQYDHMQDVLAVGPVGMLVRRDIWEQLGGFDPALPVYDDGLDFCVRARLAGHRVEVAPASRVRFAQSGVAGPRIDRRRSVLRQAHRQARTSHLHRRISYAPAFVAFFAWLGLPIYAVLRVLWALIREQPGYMVGEFVATFAVFFRPHAILASRRRIRAHSSAGWSAVRQLRIDPKSVRTARMIDREAILASSGRQRREMHFISTGGLAVLSAAAVAAVVLTWWAFPQTSLFGGGLAPLSPLDQLWANTRPVDGIPADPFTWVLALIGSLTFWNPSHAVVLLMIVSIPLTALGAWIWAAQLTDSKAGRALLALGFALSPVLLGSLEAGRLQTLVLAVVLPWLLLAASRCRESWSWAGTASLLAAAALASAPILMPAAIIMLVLGLFTTLRGVARVLTTALVPAILFAPKIFTGIVSGRPLDLLLDPGINSPFEPGTTWHLLIGYPEFGLEGWAGILDGIGLGGPPATLLIGVLMLPLALLALLGLFTGRVAVTLLHSALGALGLATAVAAGQLQLTAAGEASISVWTGSGLALYWIALLGLGAVGASALRRGAAPVVAVALAAAIIAVIPVSAQLVLNRAPFVSAAEQMPALVQAAGETDPGVRTLVITAEGDHAVRAELVTGSGLRLDEIRTALTTPVERAADRQIAELVAGLASIGGADVTDALRDAGVGFVLLPSGGDDVERSELQRVFDQHQALASAGLTEQGLLWRVQHTQGQDAEVGDSATRLGGTSLSGTTIWAVQLAVLFGVLLLALPTAEVTWRPEKRKRPSRRRRRPRSAAVKPAAPAPEAHPAEGDPAQDSVREGSSAPTSEAAGEPNADDAGEPDAGESTTGEPETGESTTGEQRVGEPNDEETNTEEPHAGETNGETR